MKDFPYYFRNDVVPHEKLVDKRITHSFLIRHPAKAIKSLWVKTGVEHVQGFDYFLADEAGFLEMYALWKKVTDAGHKVTIVDADELLLDPSGVMKAYCDSVGILPFSEDMLTWQKGPVPEWDCWAGWHDDALESTGLLARKSISPIPDCSNLPEVVQKCIEECLPMYEEMFAQRIQVSQTNFKPEEGKILEFDNPEKV